MTRTAADFYHGMHEEQGAPFDRFVDEDGTVVRVETDGNGGTVEIREGRQGSAFAYDYASTRAAVCALVGHLNEASVDPEERRALVLDQLSSGPMTPREISRALGFWNAEVVGTLMDLRDEGFVEVAHECSKELGVPVSVWSLIRPRGCV